MLSWSELGKLLASNAVGWSLNLMPKFLLLLCAFMQMVYSSTQGGGRRCEDTFSNTLRIWILPSVHMFLPLYNLSITFFLPKSALRNEGRRGKIKIKGFLAFVHPPLKRQQDVIVVLASDSKYQDGWNFETEPNLAVPLHYPFHATASSDYSAHNKRKITRRPISLPLIIKTL